MNLVYIVRIYARLISLLTKNWIIKSEQCDMFCKSYGNIFSQNWNHMYQIGERLDWKLSPLHSKCVVKKILSVSFYVRTAINREFLPFMWSVCSLFWHLDINSLQISVVAANILELLLWSLCLEANAIELLLFVENCGPQPNIMILISIHWAQPWS